MSIAQTILNQLGGNQFIAMTGAKNLLAIEYGLSFKIGKNSSKVNYVEIVLNGLDLYDIKYYNVKTKDYMPVKTLIKEFDNLYSDMLQDNFTSVTGMYTKLF